MALSVAQLKQALTQFIDPNIAVAIQAKHGVGKSSIIEQMAKDLGIKCIPIFAGQFADPGDIIGLPTFVHTKTLKLPEHFAILPDDAKKACEITWKEFDALAPEQKGLFYSKTKTSMASWMDYTYTEFAPPKWWPKDQTKPVWLFIDEANRNSASSVYSCLFDLILNQKLQGRCLPPGSRVVAAFNPVTDEGYYKVAEFDPALHDRFVVYDFMPTFDEWAEWASKNGFDMRIVNYLSLNKDNLDPYATDANVPETQTKVPSRRSWGNVNTMIKNGADAADEAFAIELISGAIGKTVAVHFWSFLKKLAQMVNTNDIFHWANDIETTISRMSQADQAMTALQLFEAMKSITMTKPVAENIFKFLTTIKKENRALFYQQLANRLERGNGQEVLTAMMLHVPAFVDEYVKMTSVEISF